MGALTMKRSLKSTEQKALDEGLKFHAVVRNRLRFSRRCRASSVENSDTSSDSDLDKSVHDRPESKQRRRIKILMLGDVGVGKTALVKRWTGNEFCGDHIGTCGVDYTTKNVTVGNQQVHVQIWDTAGQERFHVITHSYYAGAHGIVLVYDVETAASERICYWLKSIRDHVDPSRRIKAIVCCNKIDLLPEKHLEDSGQVLSGRLCAAPEGFPLFLTSAKTGSGVDVAFSSIIRSILCEQLHSADPSSAVAEGLCEKHGVQVVSFKKCRAKLRCAIS